LRRAKTDKETRRRGDKENRRKANCRKQSANCKLQIVGAEGRKAENGEEEEDGRWTIENVKSKIENRETGNRKSKI
jgi:hypothetical protein